jgi:hypothetical protein
MKRLSILALVSAVSLGLAGNVTQTISYSPASLQLGTDKGYTTVDMSGFPHIEKLGAPNLPVMAYQVVVPPTAEVTGFEITDLREEPVSGTYYVMPVQYPQAWMENSKQFPFVEPNPVYYSTDAAFPAQAAELTAAGTKAGYRLASFLVYPVRYNPVTKQLSVVTRLTVKVSYATGKVHASRFSGMQISMHGADVARLVLNPEDVSRHAPPRKTQEFGSALLSPGTWEHVILTNGQYADSLARLRDWRTRQGWRSKIVLVESIAAVYPGVDTAEKMRNFLKDAETTWSTIFCFIARKDWPAHQYRVAYGNVTGYGVDYFPADMYYSCLDGSWNADGDGYWGEPNDSVDCWADMHIGMITLDGYTELSTYLAKLFRYEFTPDTGWFCKALLGNDVTFSNEYNDSIANATPSPPWFDLKMYATGGMVTPTVQGYCDSLNHGYPITAVIAHGNNDLYGMGGDVTSPIMNALTNVNRMSMITAVCCHTGEYDATGNTNGDCIAENMAFHAPNGFIGVDMNTRYGWVAVAEFFNYSICYGLLGTRSARRITQGEALSYGRDYWHALVAVTTDTSKFRWEAYERTLFGEPAVPIWMGKAFNVSVTKPSAISIGSGVPVDITVNSQDGPVDSAMVCLIKGTETFARGFTAANGQLTLYVTPLTPGWLQLTVTGANNIPYLDSIQVVSSGKFVCYLRHFISDPTPGGNGDSIINPGESFRIPMWVKNYGTLPASGVNGRLIAHTAGVTISDSIKSFGTVNGGDSAYNAQGFGMNVDTGLPNNYAIPCSLVCNDSDDSTWVSYVTFRVGSPVIAYVDKAVKDSAGSIPNGRLDPGEIADLEVTLRNAGLGNATNVQALLKSGDSRLTVPDTFAVYGSIPHESTAVNRTDHFTLRADDDMPPETPVACTLKVIGDGGYAVTLSFTLVVGEIRAIDPIPDGPRVPARYYAFDESDAAYEQHPTYNWVEINSLGTRLAYSHNDEVLVVNLPTGFGPLRFYGQRDSQISVSADGWACPGNYVIPNYDNTGLPDPSTPPGMICANWDDLYPASGGGGDGNVYYYHDATNHRFIIEYDSVGYYWGSERDKFEVIISDTTVVTPTGDNDILVQYMTAAGYFSSTLGIEDPTRAIAIQALYDGTYHHGCAPIAAGRAIRYTTDEPVTAFSEPAGGVNLTRKPLEVSPNPFNASARINWQMRRDGTADLRVFDASGRVVRILASGPCPAGSYTTVWNGADNAGRKLAHGIYFVRLTTPDQTAKVKTVLAR